MREIIIRLKENEFGATEREVIENGETTGPLTWDEMLGQIASMTFPVSKGTPLYRMATSEQWEKESEDRAARCAEQESPT